MIDPKPVLLLATALALGGCDLTSKSGASEGASASIFSGNASAVTADRATASNALTNAELGRLIGTSAFFVPLIWLGFPPRAVFITLNLNLLYQFWIHTDWVPKLGPLEWVLNTPSHHRVHHGSNPQYLDKNYAGVLIVWDRMFGSFQAVHIDTFGSGASPIPSEAFCCQLGGIQ